METTTNLELRKPSTSDYYDVDDMNTNSDKIDTAYKEIKDEINDLNISDCIKLENGVAIFETIAAGGTISRSHYEQIYSDSFYPKYTGVIIELKSLHNEGSPDFNETMPLIGRVGETLEISNANNTATISIALNTNGFVITNTGTTSIQIQANFYMLNARV